MNKLEVIKKVVKNAAKKGEKISQNDVNIVLSSFCDVVKEIIGENVNEKVTLGDLGSFKGKVVPQRTGVSALTGQEWKKPKHNELVFKVSSKSKVIS